MSQPIGNYAVGVKTCEEIGANQFGYASPTALCTDGQLFYLPRQAPVSRTMAHRNSVGIQVLKHEFSIQRCKVAFLGFTRIDWQLPRADTNMLYVTEITVGNRTYSGLTTNLTGPTLEHLQIGQLAYADRLTILVSPRGLFYARDGLETGVFDQVDMDRLLVTRNVSGFALSYKGSWQPLYVS